MKARQANPVRPHISGRSARIAAVAALGLLAASGAVANEIRVCSDSWLRGQCVTVRGSTPDLSRLGFNNTISSFQVRSGTWNLCTGPGYTGRCEIVTGSAMDLRGTPLQDNVSSLQPYTQRPPVNRPEPVWPPVAGGVRGSAILYMGPNYTGRYLQIDGSVPNLDAYNLRGRVQSVRINGGRWSLCAFPNYTECTEVNQSVPNLSLLGLSNRLASVALNDTSVAPGFPPPTDPGWGGPGESGPGWGGSGGSAGGSGGYATAVLYSDAGFRGRALHVAQGFANLRDQGFNDIASSMRITGGRWQVCTDAYFRGRCVVVTGSVSDFQRLGVNDQISSIRRY